MEIKQVFCTKQQSLFPRDTEALGSAPEKAVLPVSVKPTGFHRDISPWEEGVRNLCQEHWSTLEKYQGLKTYGP